MLEEIAPVPYDQYQRWLARIVPPWLQGIRGRSLVSGLGGGLDEHASLVATGVLARFVQRAPEDALTTLGAERNLNRYPGELTSAFRSRVLAAWDFWQWAGTLPGVLFWLSAAGYDAYVYEHFRDDPSIWAEFSVYLWPKIAEYTTDRWDEGGAWDDATTWDFTLAATELLRVPALLREVKPAHAKLRGVYYIPGPKDAWDDGAGAWDDGGVWNQEPLHVV